MQRYRDQIKTWIQSSEIKDKKDPKEKAKSETRRWLNNVAEKNELRDEKKRLKIVKERLEQQLKTMNAQSSFMPPTPAFHAAIVAAQGQAPGNKLVPFFGYPGVAMWQFMPPAVVDTSKDHVLRPPVA